MYVDLTLLVLIVVCFNANIQGIITGYYVSWAGYEECS